MYNDMYEQLIKEVHDLKIGLADTKKQLAESTAESKELRKLLCAEKENNKRSTAKGNSPKGNSSSEAKPPGIPTGITDERGEELFLDDIVRLITPSTGSFLRLNKFQKGDSVEVYGITKNHDLKVRDPENHKLRTVRKGESVIRLEQQYD